MCYLTPAQGYFQVSIIYNDKGRALAANATLPAPVAQAVEAAKENPKNIPYDFEVYTDTDMEVAKKLIAIRAKT